MAWQYVAVSWLAQERIKAGANGATLAIMINAIALAGLSIAILLFILLPLPEGIVMLCLFGVMFTNFNLIIALQIEAQKPIKRQSALMERIHRELKK